MRIPYELIEGIFGTWVASNFSTICTAIVFVAILIKLAKTDKPKKTTKKKGKWKAPKWYPTGWVFNEETQLWEPPDYISKD